MEQKNILEGESLDLNDSEVELAKEYLKEYTGDGEPFYIEDKKLHMNDFYVGTLSFPNKIIQIEPRMKFIDFEDLIQIWLLSDNLNNNIKSNREYGSQKDNFRTALIDRFLDELEELVSGGKHLNYREVSENRSSVKGKIKPEIPSKPGKINCEFDTLTQNNTPNKIIKQSLIDIGSFELSKNQEFKINRLLTYFKHIDNVKDLNSKLIDETLRRHNFNNKRYSNVLRIIKLLTDSRLSAKNNSIEYKSFLEDYNELFEEFIRNILNIYSNYYIPTKKTSVEYGKIEYDGEDIPKEYEADLIIENDQGKVIAVGDVKNKYRGSFRKTFFNNSDVFQILFYMEKEDVDLGVLVYPSSETYEPANLSVETSNGEIKEIFAVPIPIKGNIDVNSRKFVEEFDSTISSSI